MRDERRHRARDGRRVSLHGQETTSVSADRIDRRRCSHGYSSNAYELACLGETSNTWEALGHACIEQGDFVLAKKCFSRVRDMKYLSLIANFEVRLREAHSSTDPFFLLFVQDAAKRGETKMNNNLGDYYAYSGRFPDAARNYQQAGAPERAMAMFSDLRMFDLAKVRGFDAVGLTLIASSGLHGGRRCGPAETTG